MKKFEYLQQYFGSHEFPEYRMLAYLNSKGSEGWELVQIIEKSFANEPWRTANYTFIFKRPLGK